MHFRGGLWLPAASALLVLAGCAMGDLQRAREAEPSGDAFSQALHGEYLAVAEKENAETDFDDASFFARRAEAAAEGQFLLPDRVVSRDLPDTQANDDTIDARDRLVLALNDNARTQVPGTAARAQAMFDCWLEELEDDSEPEDIAACREAFFAALEDAEAAVAEKAEAPMEAEEPEVLPEMVEAEPETFTVHFAFDSAELRPAEEAVVADAAEAAGERPEPQLSLTGHADRAGSEAYNMALSLRRAETVRDALAGRGVPGDAMSVAARGESEPVVPTPDGVAEAANRRVEIVLE